MLTICGSDEAAYVGRGAMFALRQISKLPSGAQAVVDAKLLNLVTQLLGSSDSYTRQHTSFMLGNLAKHESTSQAVLALEPCIQLVSLLRCVSKIL